MLCSVCSTEAPEDDLFCENCGADLRVQERAGQEGCTCGSGAEEIDAEGFCERCGRRVRRPPSDHMEQTLSPHCAAVSDRGLRHDRNEDRFAIFVGDTGSALVVCDGVSATPHSEQASAEVAAVALSSLAEAIRKGIPSENRQSEAEGAVRAAIHAASAGVLSLGRWHGEGDTPSTTVVAALVLENLITIGWVGDSRAYWLGDGAAAVLTEDHSWRNEVLQAGRMSAAEADASPEAHAITRWIGADAGEAGEPSLVQHTFLSPGTLILCTDGLWNYAESAEAMAAVAALGEQGSEGALDVCRRLVAFALGRGGRDNITVALLRLRSPDPSDAIVPSPPGATELN